MKIEKKLRKCDNCDTEVEDKNMIGGHSFHGWFEVDRINGSTRFSTTREQQYHGPWDFCSQKCLIEFISEKKFTE